MATAESVAPGIEDDLTSFEHDLISDGWPDKKRTWRCATYGRPTENLAVRTEGVCAGGARSEPDWRGKPPLREASELISPRDRLQ